MNTLTYFSKLLSSPILAHREQATVALVVADWSDARVVAQLGTNLHSSNLDVVCESLKALQAICLRKPIALVPIERQLVDLGLRSSHFSIVARIDDILGRLPAARDTARSHVARQLQPTFAPMAPDDFCVFGCDYFVELALGSQDLKYHLSHICETFRYPCSKAIKQVTRYMRDLGYNSRRRDWTERPSRWRNDFYGHHYETSRHYCARHALQLFLMWCVKQLPISECAWRDLLLYERDWDPSIPSLLITPQPTLLEFPDVQTPPKKWLQRRITKREVYALYSQQMEWVPLSEATHFRTDDKWYDRYVTTIFWPADVKLPPRGTKLPLPYLRTSKAFINELPSAAAEDGRLELAAYDSGEDLPAAVMPTHGRVEQGFGCGPWLFPTSDMVSFGELRQVPNTLTYYKGERLVAQYTNWRDGYRWRSGREEDERFELGNHGSVLLIRASFLRQYLSARNYRLVAVGNVLKRLSDRYRPSLDMSRKDVRTKYATFEVIEP